MRRLTVLAAGTFLAVPVFAQTAGGSNAAPNRAARAGSVSPAGPIKPFQELGSFPTNTVTNRPFVGPQQGGEGYRKTVAALQRTLTELQQLQLQEKQAHWNVSGTLWHPLHLMLQEHYEGTSKLADMVAERLLAIGSSADGRAHTIVQTSSIPEFPGGFVDDASVIVWFTNAYKLVGDQVRQAILDVDDADPTTGNLLQTVEDGIDKYQWMMRAFLQRTPTDANDGRDLNAGRPVDLPDRTPAGLPPAGGQPPGAQPAREQTGNGTR